MSSATPFQRPLSGVVRRREEEDDEEDEHGDGDQDGRVRSHIGSKLERGSMFRLQRSRRSRTRIRRQHQHEHEHEDEIFQVGTSAIPRLHAPRSGLRIGEIFQ